MSKADALKRELEKMGIFTDAELRAAIRSISIDISLMTAVHQEERMAG